MTPRPTLPCLAALAAALACSGGAAAPAADASAQLGPTERGVIRLVNGFRAQNGLDPVRASRGLNRAAEAHSRDMLQSNFFDHSSSDGTSFDRRVRRFARAGLVGETLAAFSQADGGAAVIVQMWISSPPHRAILLTRGFRRIGVSRLRGMLGASRQTVVTADFASGRR
jgi:uncharacterized protein YkwD